MLDFLCFCVCPKDGASWKNVLSCAAVQTLPTYDGEKFHTWYPFQVVQLVDCRYALPMTRVQFPARILFHTVS